MKALMALDSDPRSRFDDSQRAELIRRYLAGEPSTDLGRRFGVTHQTIRKHLRFAGAEIKSPHERRRLHTCDDKFFDHVNTEEKAYWLGFIAADGCIRTPPKGEKILTIKLRLQDHSHLATFRKHLQATNPVRTIDPPRALFIVNSPGLVSGLISHGITPRKSLTQTWPNCVSEDLLPHFLRGYSDGDGCFSRNRRPDRSDQARWDLCGTEPFLKQCQQYLSSTLGFQFTNLSMSGAIHLIHYGGNRQIARLAHLLYDNATVYLARKREKIEHLL